MATCFKPKIISLAIASCFLATDTSIAFAAQLEEVVVTARKREESLQDTPVVVKVLSDETLKAFNINNFDNLASLEPTLLIDGESGGPANPIIQLRGIQSGSINTFNDQAVSINIDGVQFSNSQVLRAGQFDLERIQVLKGPQPLFFGKNSTGGIIAIETAGPTDELFTEISLGYAIEAETTDITGIIAGPLSDSVGGRLAVNYLDTEGYYENEYPGVADKSNGNYDQLMARGTLEFDFDDLFITFKTTYSNREGGGTSFTQTFGCEDTPETASRLPFEDCELNETSSRADPGQSPFWNRSDSPFYRSDTPEHEYEMMFSSLELEYDFNDNWTLNSVTGYNSMDNYQFETLFPGAATPFFLPAFFVAHRETEFKTLSQEFRFTGIYDTARYTVGVFVDDRSIDLLQVQNFFAQMPAFTRNLDSEAISIFAQAEFDLTDQWTFSLGGRYIEETKTLKGANISAGIFALNPVTGPFAVPAGPHQNPTNELEEENFSPEVTLSYQPTDDYLLYATYKEAFKSGSFETDTVVGVLSVAPFAPREVSFRPETVEGFELGTKMQFLDDTLRVNLAAFDYEYEDLQLLAYDPETVSNRTVNAGTSTVQGLEADITYLTPLDGLLLTASLARIEANYDDYIGQCNPDQLQGFQAGCTIDEDGDGEAESQVRDGDPLRGAADWNLNFGINYDISISDSLRFRSNLNAAWTDEYFADEDNNSRFIQDAAWNVGLNLGLYAEDESWAVDLIGSNITDEVILNATGPSPVIGVSDGRDPYFGTRNNPREVMLRFTIRPSILFN